MDKKIKKTERLETEFQNFKEKVIDEYVKHIIIKDNNINGNIIFIKDPNTFYTKYMVSFSINGIEHKCFGELRNESDNIRMIDMATSIKIFRDQLAEKISELLINENRIPIPNTIFGTQYLD